MASNKKLYKDAVSSFGHEAQINVAIKECASLISELQKHKLGRRDCDVQQSIADMEIMCNQLRIIFPGVNDIKKERLLRLQEMINQRVR